jgi:glycosyltransferase involved in cell wall biosynthesis
MKDVVLVCETFYPDSRVAAIRISYLAKHLPQYGYNPIIVTSKPFSASERVKAAQFLNSDTVEIHSLSRFQDALRSSDPVSNRPLLRRKIVSHLKPSLARLASIAMIPDQRSRYWRAAARRIEDLIADRPVHGVITSGPAHSIHAVGLHLRSLRPDLAWVADFRDPLVIDPRFGAYGIRCVRSGAFARYERSIYEYASAVVHAIPMHARWAARRYRSYRAKQHLIPNGVPADILQPRTRAVSDDYITVTSVGTLEPREFKLLTEALRRIDGCRIRLQIVGPSPTGRTERLKVDQHEAWLVGSVPHVEALNYVMSPTILIAALGGTRARGLGLSSKLFEYMVSGNQVLVLNPTRSDRLFFRRYRNLLLLSNAGPDELSQALSDVLARPQSDEDNGVARQFYDQYNRAKVAEQFAAALCSEDEAS